MTSKETNPHHNHKRHYQHLKVKKLEGSEVEISGEIVTEEIERCRALALTRLSTGATVEGFRKGHVPETVLVTKFGENFILEEAAEIALSHEYAHMIVDEKLEVIGRPEITLTKVARGNPLGFKIKVAVFPEITMPAYAKIAKAEMKEEVKVEVTEKEVADAIEQIRKHYQEGDASEAESGDASAPAKKAELPVFDDAFVKKLGAFETVADFKTKLKENILSEKTLRAKEKKRLQIGEKMVAESKMDLPELLIAGEIRKMWAEFEGDISRMGLKPEDYLKHVKKTREEMEKDWRGDAEKRVKLQIILNRIATEEKLAANEEDIQKEVDALMKAYEGADPERARTYVETVLTNEKVFRFLEGQK